MAFPDIVEKDFSEGGKNNQSVHEMLDYAANQWLTKDSRLKRISSLYNSHNGIISKEETEAITKSTGKQSKTKHVQYRLGRTKLKQLHGEFLEINIEPTVRSTNREAINRKMEKYRSQLGLSLSKPYIERVRSLGYNVFSGVNIPNIDDKNAWNVKNFKLTNEMIIQRIIEDKMLGQRLKTSFYNNFQDCTIVSELFGKVERNANGIDTYRYIPAKYALYQESISDMFLEQSPYLGEVRPMFMHEILSNKEFNLDDEDKKKLKELVNGSNPDTRNIQSGDGGGNLINVYTIEWKALEPVYVKISPAGDSEEPYMRMLDPDYYAKNKRTLKRGVKDGLYTIEKYYRQILWSASRIHSGIYTAAKKESNLIQRMNENGKYTVDFNYCGMLFSTIDGVRVSVQEIIQELEKVYDEIRFNINREMKKMKGSLAYYDKAFLPKGKKISDIMHQITEDGLVEFNSSAEGNASGMELPGNYVGVGAINLGQNQNLMILLNQAMDIERVMDRVTGMNENRQGLSKATTTATANVNNIEASRSMTYDLFYFMQQYIERTLTKLAEKTKINRVYLGADQRKFIFDDGEMMYMLSTDELDFDNYGITITDGKKEKDIMMKLENLFPQEINAGLLRTKDVARFWTESSFAAALKVLDNAHDELAKIRQDELRIKQESSFKQIEQAAQQAIEEREDNQAHDRDMEVLRTEGGKEKIQLQETLKFQQASMKESAKLAAPAKTEKTF